MSHQFSITFSTTEGEDDLARFDGIISKSGYNVIGGDLEMALETKNVNPLLNDVGRVEGKTPSLSAIGSVVAQFKNFDGTFDTDIKAPASRLTNPLDIGGMRVIEDGGFVYDAPTVLSSDWDVGQQPKMVDRIFLSDPAILNVDNNESKETTFDFLTAVSRDITFKIQANIITGAPALSFAFRGSNTGKVDDFTDIETGVLTSDVSVLSLNNASFQFYQLELKAISTDLFSVDFLIFELSGIISPTVLSSDWDAPNQALMVDKDIDTFGTLVVNPTGTSRSNTTFDFGSIAARSIISKVREISTASDLHVRVLKSDDNILFVPVLSTPQFLLEWTEGTNITGITVDHNDFIYVTDTILNRIAKYDNQGNFILSWSSGAAATNGVASDSVNNIYVVTENPDIVTKYTDTGTFITSWGGVGGDPEDITIDTNDDVYVHATTDDRIFKTDNVGVAITSWIVDSNVGGIASDSNNNIYTASTTTDLIKKYTSTGTFILSFPTTEIGGNPLRVAVDSNNLIYVTRNDDVGLYTDTGTFILQWATATTATISRIGVAKDTSDDIYIAKSSDTAIEKWSFNEPLITNIPLDITSSETFRYIQLQLYSFNIAAYSATKDIFEIFETGETPIVTSSGWASTSNMIDGDFITSDTVNATNDPTTGITTFDFGNNIDRIPTVNLLFETISGTPTYSFDLEISNNNISFTSVDTGAPLSDVFTTAIAASQAFRYMRITMSATGGGVEFESDFSIFEGWDTNILNGLDFSTVKVSGATQTTIPNKPWQVEVSDGQSVLQPNQMFGVLEDKDLTMQVISHRTGQKLTLDRITTRVINRA